MSAGEKVARDRPVNDRGSRGRITPQISVGANETDGQFVDKGGEKAPDNKADADERKM